MVVLTTCTLAIAQNNTTVVQDSVGNVKISVKKSSKANANNTAVTVVGVDAMDADSTDIDADSSSVSHGSASFSINTDDDDFPFYDFGNAVSGLFNTDHSYNLCIRLARVDPVHSLLLPLQEPEGTLSPCRTGTCDRTTVAGRLYPGKQTCRPMLTRYQKHIYRYRTFHLPLGNYRRIRNRNYRTASCIYGHRAMDYW